MICALNLLAWMFIKKSTLFAIVDYGSDGEVRLYRTIKNTTEDIDKVIRKSPPVPNCILSIKRVLVVLASIVISAAMGLAA